MAWRIESREVLFFRASLCFQSFKVGIEQLELGDSIVLGH